MHRITLTIILLLSSTAATNVDASSYQLRDGSIVDPIQSVEGGDLSYSGNNLEPGAELYFAELMGAALLFADLTSADLRAAQLDGAMLIAADLTNARLTSAELPSADLTNAHLTGADLSGAVLSGADLWSADLSGSDFSNVHFYDDATWTDAFYYTDNEPTWHWGMAAAWRTSVGILAVAPTNAVPEPSTLLLALIGLALVPLRRRR